MAASQPSRCPNWKRRSDPSPAEIAERAADVRATWSPSTERARRAWAAEAESVEPTILGPQDLGDWVE